MTGLHQPRAGARRDVVPLREATRAWFEISLQTFGGPAGQIAVMQRTLVEERRWIGQQRFLFALSGIYVAFGETTVVDALFLGLAPAVIAIVVQAVTRVARKGLTHPTLVGLAVAAFLALSVFGVPFPVVVAAATGWALARVVPALGAPPPSRPDDGPAPAVSDDALHTERPSGRRAAGILAIGLALWAAPVVLAAVVAGRSSTYVDQGLFFSGAAVVTFGGAYAVLAYVAQQAVSVYGWLAPGEMVRAPVRGTPARQPVPDQRADRDHRRRGRRHRPQWAAP